MKNLTILVVQQRKLWQNFGAGRKGGKLISHQHVTSLCFFLSISDLYQFTTLKNMFQGLTSAFYTLKTFIYIKLIYVHSKK